MSDAASQIQTQNQSQDRVPYTSLPQTPNESASPQPNQVSAEADRQDAALAGPEPLAVVEKETPKVVAAQLSISVGQKTQDLGLTTPADAPIPGTDVKALNAVVEASQSSDAPQT